MPRSLRRPAFQFALLALFFSVAILGAAALAEELGYLWPAEDKVEVTSVFCDKRNGHPHGGIDLSHFGKVGQVPIRSVQDGVLLRIRSSKYGYGNAVYVRMPGKQVAVYAHLDRFSPRLQKVADRIRQKTGLKQLDYYFEKWELTFSIKKGELLGYGGNTGTRTPHLHFELRYDDLVNLNPLTNGFFVHDTVAPTIAAAMLTPVDPDARVNGKSRPHVIRFTPSGKSAGSTGPIRVTGRVGLSVNAHDRHRPGGAAFSPYRIVVEVDGDPFFETRYEQWSYFDQTVWFVQYDTDPTSRRRFLRAYNPYPVRIPFFSEPDAGTFERLDEGDHTVRIRVDDAVGQSRAAEFLLRVEASDEPGRRPWPRGTGKHRLFNETVVAIEEGRFALEGYPYSFFEPVAVDVTKAPPPDREGVGACYVVSDPGVFIRQPFGVRFSIDPGNAASSGVYRMNEGNPEWIGGKYDPDHSTVTGQTMEFGTYCLIEDTIAPVLSSLKVRSGSKALAGFLVSDDLSGLRKDSVRAIVDGHLALVDFDRRSGRTSVELDQPPTRGDHVIVVTMQDRSGNRAVRKIAFTRK